MALPPPGQIAESLSVALGFEAVDERMDGLASRLNVTATMLGATTINSAAANLAAFNALATPGVPIDLQGSFYPVTSEPNNANYFNGGFIVGADVIFRNSTPRRHPFVSDTMSVKVVDPTQYVYRGLCVAQFDLGGDLGMLYLWRQAPGHGNEDGDPIAGRGPGIYAARTEDFGNSFVRPSGPGNGGEMPQLVYRRLNADTRNFSAGPMSSGRVGVMAVPVLADGSQLEPVFIYSDNPAAATPVWSSYEVPMVSGTVNFHSRIYPHPGSANSYITYGYESNGAGINAVKTTDNGATWTDLGRILPKGPHAALTELSVVRVGNQNKWIMLIRSSANMLVSVSTDMETWSVPVVTNLSLKGNPPEALYEDGRIWNLSASRTGAKVIKPGFENAIVIASADGDAVFASGGTALWSGWDTVQTCPSFTTSYFSTAKVKGRWSALFNIEDYAFSTQSRTGYLMLLGPDAPSQASFAAGLKAVPAPNLVPNGGLRLWSKGTSITGAARASVADGFTFARSSSVTGWTVSKQVGSKNGVPAMRVQRDAGNTATQAMTLCMCLSEEDSIQFINQQVMLSLGARCGANFSAATPGFLTVQVRQTATGGQVVTSTGGTYGTGDTALGTSSSGLFLDGQWRFFQMSPGRVAGTTKQIMLRWTWAPTGTAGADDWFEIEMVKLELGAQATPFVFEPIAMTMQRCEKYIQVFEDRTINGAADRTFPTRMFRTPTTVVSTLGATSLATQSGYRLTHTADAAVTVTADGFL